MKKVRKIRAADNNCCQDDSCSTLDLTQAFCEEKISWWEYSKQVLKRKSYSDERNLIITFQYYLYYLRDRLEVFIDKVKVFIVSQRRGV